MERRGDRARCWLKCGGVVVAYPGTFCVAERILLFLHERVSNLDYWRGGRTPSSE